MEFTFDLTHMGWPEYRLSVGFESLARSWSHWYHDLPPLSQRGLGAVFYEIDSILAQVADQGPPMVCPYRGTLFLAYAESVHEILRRIDEENDEAVYHVLANLSRLYDDLVDPNVPRLQKLLASWSPSTEHIQVLPAQVIDQNLLPSSGPIMVPSSPGRVPLEFYADYTLMNPAKLTFNPLPSHVGPMYFVCLGLRSLIYFWSEYFHDLPGLSLEKVALIYGEARLNQSLHSSVAINQSYFSSRERRDLLRLALAQAYMDWEEITDTFEEDENGDYPEEYTDICNGGPYITCLLRNLDPNAKPADWFVAATGFTYN